jgi:hypothetical protein
VTPDFSQPTKDNDNKTINKYARIGMIQIIYHTDLACVAGRFLLKRAEAAELKVEAAKNRIIVI